MANKYLKGSKPCDHPIRNRRWSERTDRVYCSRCGKKLTEYELKQR